MNENKDTDKVRRYNKDTGCGCHCQCGQFRSGPWRRGLRCDFCRSRVCGDGACLPEVGRLSHLPCSYIIHTVGPVWNGGTHNEAGLLASCYQNSLDIAVKKGIKKIAFPSISTGIYHFPVELAAESAAAAVKQFLVGHDGALDEIIWVLFDARTKLIYDSVISREFGR